MKISSIKIDNFRGIKQLLVDLDETTVLIGENNSGKSTILDAIRVCLGRSLNRKSGQFSEYDYHLVDETSKPHEADPISLTFLFKESEVDEWPDEISQTLDEATQVDAITGLTSLTLRISSQYDKAVGDFITQWDYLDGAGNPLSGKAKQPRMVIELQKLIPVFYLNALRDAANEFRPRSKFWGPFVRNIDIDQDVQDQLEKELSDLNSKILSAHTAFSDVTERLKETTKLVPLDSDDPVAIEALPAKVFDMLARTQVMLKGTTGTSLPLYHHGEGTQSLAVLFLFDAFLNNRLTEQHGEHAEPILALEEPEAHLHPSAVRSLGGILQALSGQKIIASHSGDLLASVPLQSVRRLARKNGECSIYRIQEADFTPDELDKITYHIRSQRGRLLFSRCWLLVEGQTEYWLMPEFARIMGEDLELNGVCCVEYRQFDIAPLIRLADALGISWHVLTDNDSQGEDDIRKIEAQLNGRVKAQHLSTLTEKDPEHSLWNIGYQYVYENAVSPNRRAAITVANTDPNYQSEVIKHAVKSTSKPYLATVVCQEAAKPGSPGIPAVMNNAINAAIKLAKDS